MNNKQFKKYAPYILFVLAISLIMLFTTNYISQNYPDGVPTYQDSGTITVEDKIEVFDATTPVIVIDNLPTEVILPTTFPEPVPKEQYTVPVEMQEASIGILTIPKIDLVARVYETDDEIEAMTKGVAHFKSTSAWEGNIGLCSHNVAPQGALAFFRDIHLLVQGDVITYETALGIRSYTVQTIVEISDEDWSYLDRTADNRITLITCITDKPEMRLMVQAIES